MQAEFSGDQILAGRSLRNCIPIRIQLEQLPGRNKLLQALVQCTALIAMQSQLAHELLVTSGLLWLALDLFQNDGIGEHVVISTWHLAFGQKPYGPNAKCQLSITLLGP